MSSGDQFRMSVDKPAAASLGKLPRTKYGLSQSRARAADQNLSLRQELRNGGAIHPEKLGAMVMAGGRSCRCTGPPQMAQRKRSFTRSVRPQPSRES